MDEPDFWALLECAAWMRNVNEGLRRGDAGYAYDAATTRSVFRQKVEALCMKYDKRTWLDAFNDG
jgi:hypothetical protein